MKNVYIYGTGSKTLKFLPALSLHFKVIGFLDSDIGKHGQRLLGLEISHVSTLDAGACDDIIIVSTYVDDIKKTLADYGLIGIALEQMQNVLATHKEYALLEDHYRQQANSRLPQVPLQKKHLASARLITDRNALLELLPKRGVSSELGVANGAYTEQILKINAPQKLHLIDIWHSERYNETLFKDVCSKFASELSTGQMQIHRKLSTKAVDDFPEQYFDWIYIDTSHCYEGTKAELELYASKIKPGGIIAGHDYTMGNWNNQFRYGVMEAVHEFCVVYGWRIKYLTMDLSEGQSFAIEKLD